MKKYTILTSLLILVLTMVPVRATGSQALKHILASLKKYGDENIMTSDQYDNYYQPAIESMEALVTSSDENAPAATTINRKAFTRPGTITRPDGTTHSPLTIMDRIELDLMKKDIDRQIQEYLDRRRMEREEKLERD